MSGFALKPNFDHSFCRSNRRFGLDPLRRRVISAMPTASLPFDPEATVSYVKVKSTSKLCAAAFVSSVVNRV